MNNERISIIEKAIEVMEEGLEKYQNELNEVNEEIGLFEEDNCPYLEQDKKNINRKIRKLEVALPLFAMPRVVGKIDGKDIKANVGKFGPYLEVNRVYYPLRDKDPYTIDLETSLQVIKDTEEWRKNNPPKDRPKGVWKRTFKKR